MATTDREILAVTGNEATAEAMCQIDPDAECPRGAMTMTREGL